VYGRLREFRQRSSQQSRKIAELNRRLSEQEHAIADLNRRIVEYDQRFDDLFAEIVRVRAVESGTSVRQTKRRIMKRNVSKSSHENDGNDASNSCLVPSSDSSNQVADDRDILAEGSMSCVAGFCQYDEESSSGSISADQCDVIETKRKKRNVVTDKPEDSSRPPAKMRRLKAAGISQRSSQRCLRNK
jgi:uncharacterized coiled-coil protein SlyX